jgi:hypothetical protein
VYFIDFFKIKIKEKLFPLALLKGRDITIFYCLKYFESKEIKAQRANVYKYICLFVLTLCSKFHNDNDSDNNSRKNKKWYPRTKKTNKTIKKTK